MNPKKILDTVSAIATAIGLIAQIVNNATASKKQTIEIHEAVAKEISKQMNYVNANAKES